MLIPFLQPERASWEQSEYSRLFGKRGEIQKSSPYSFSLWRARLRHPAEWPSSTCLLICITSLPHISSEYSRLQWQEQFWRRIRTPNFGYVDHGHLVNRAMLQKTNTSYHSNITLKSAQLSDGWHPDFSARQSITLSGERKGRREITVWRIWEILVEKEESQRKAFCESITLDFC